MSDAQLITFAVLAFVGLLMIGASYRKPVEDDWPDFEGDFYGDDYSYEPPVGEELSVRLAMATGKCVIVNWNGEGYDVDLHGAEPPEWLGEDFRGHPITITG